jgi:hypothetical protein
MKIGSLEKNEDASNKNETGEGNGLTKTKCFTIVATNYTLA